MAQQVQNEARWQWSLEDDQGRYVAGAAIVADGDRRGWFVGYPGNALVSSIQLRPMIRLFNILASAGIYDELRAWVAHDDYRAIHFAKSFKFVYDCGPATGFSPTGRDLDLFLWRRS